MYKGQIAQDTIHILYAEDEKSTREFVKLLFKKIEGIEVTFAKDGQEALELYKLGVFDLVATDIYMPNMDGFELIDNIKQINPAQIFVMVTSMDDKEHLIKAISLRINLFLQKPLDKAEFIKTFEFAKKIVTNKFHHQKLQDEYEKQHRTFESLLSKQKSLLCITNFSKTIFTSGSFLKFFDIEESSEFDTKHRSLLKYFIQHPDYISGENKEEFLRAYEQQEENKRFVWIEYNAVYKSFKIDIEKFNYGFYIITLTDVSSLKEVQNSLTQELEQKLQLIQQQEQMILHQSKLAAMGEMLDAVAHQWKQPLNIIKMRADFLKIINEEEQVATEEIEETMKSIISQTNHLTETLQEFRGFFRPAEDLKEVKVQKLLDSTLILLKDELLKHQIDIESKGNLDSKINILPNEFKHVFINLINNSKDAYLDNKIDTDNRKIFIFVEDFDHKVVITIQDKAGGIPSDIIENIFEPNITTKEYGTGIGLYMTKQIVNKINGSLNVKNFDNGAVFMIELPK